MEIVATILGLVALVGVAIVIVEVVIWTIEQVIEWFSSIDTLSADAVCFTIREAERTGQVTYIQGVLNKNTDTLIGVRKVKAQQTDAFIQDAHSENPVVIYD